MAMAKEMGNSTMEEEMKGSMTREISKYRPQEPRLHMLESFTRDESKDILCTCMQ